MVLLLTEFKKSAKKKLLPKLKSFSLRIRFEIKKWLQKIKNIQKLKQMVIMI